MNWIVNTLNRWTGARERIRQLQVDSTSLAACYEDAEGEVLRLRAASREVDRKMKDLVAEVALLNQELKLRDETIARQDLSLAKWQIESQLSQEASSQWHRASLTAERAYDAIVAEMEAARLTKSQLDEQFDIQLEMDKHRVDLEDELTEMRSKLAMMGYHLSNEKNTAASLNSEIYDLRRRVNIETDKANAWEKHYCEKRDECNELRNSLKKVVRTA